MLLVNLIKYIIQHYQITIKINHPQRIWYQRHQCCWHIFLSFILWILCFNSNTVFVNSSICSTVPPVPDILTPRHFIISTPNFPSKFETPYCMEWIIDAHASYLAPERNKTKHIYLYLNQMYLKTNVTITASKWYPSEHEDLIDDFDYEEAQNETEQEHSVKDEGLGFRTSHSQIEMHHESIDELVQTYIYEDEETYDDDEGSGLDPIEYETEILDETKIGDESSTNKPQEKTRRHIRRRKLRNATEPLLVQQQNNSQGQSNESKIQLSVDNQIHKEQDESQNFNNLRPASLVSSGRQNTIQNELIKEKEKEKRWEPDPRDTSKLRIGPEDCSLKRKRPKTDKSGKRSTMMNDSEIYTYPVLLRGEQLRRLDLVYTTCRYLSIKVEIYSPYTSALRVRNHLLDVYGFNVSYNVVDVEEPPNNDSCSAFKCNYNGHCRVSDDYQNFSCECHPGSVGKLCQYDDTRCNKALNLTFCQNGGTCRLFGAGHGMCYCPEGHTGQLCEIKLKTSPKVCPSRRQCEENCKKLKQLQEANNDIYARDVRSFHKDKMMYNGGSPSCPCEKPPDIPKDWLLYEGVLQTTVSNLPVWEYKSTRPVKRSLSGLSSSGITLKERIEEELEKKLERLFIGSSNLLHVAITSFSSQSRFAFNFFGPPSIFNETNEILTNLTSTGQLFTDFGLATNFIPQLSTFPQVYIGSLTINRSIQLQLSKDFTITCLAYGSQFVSFKWFKDGIEINEKLALRNILKSSTPTRYRSASSFRSTSLLFVDHASTADTGTFTCQVTDFGNQEQCTDLSVGVITQPIIEILPRSLTLVRNETGRTVLCAATVESPNSYAYSWYKDGIRVQTDDNPSIGGSNLLEVTENIYPYGLLLRIVKANESATFTCKIRNRVGEGTDEIYVQVLPSSSSLSCRAEVDRYNLKWNLTGLDQTAKIFCPQGYVGFVQRVCTTSSETGKPVWGSADFSRCLSTDLKKINATFKSFVAGFAVLDGFSDIILKLNQHIIRKNSLYSGEGEKIISVLNDIGEYAVKKVEFIKQSNFQSVFFQAASSLLRFPASCIHRNSVLKLIKQIHETSAQFYNESNSTSISSYPHQNDVVVIEHVQMEFNESQLFPKIGNNHKYPNWLNVQLFLDRRSPNDTALGSFFITVLKNITCLIGSKIPCTYQQFQSQQRKMKRESSSLATSTHSPFHHLHDPLEESIQPNIGQIGSPIFYFSSNNYVPKTNSHFFLTYTLNSDMANELDKKRINITCGTIVDENDEEGKVLSWIKNYPHCTLVKISGPIIHCRCDRPGQYALLVHTLEQKSEIIELKIHWPVLAGSIFCIVCCALSFVAILGHLHCQIGTNSIYILKVIVCISLIASLLAALPLRTSTSESSIILTTVLCTFLILSICCQFSKTINILLSTNPDLYPWLRSISSLNFVLLNTFTSTLPVWISATIFSQNKSSSSTGNGDDSNDNLHGDTVNNVFKEESPVFVSFVGTMILTLLSLLITYYKASLELRQSRGNIENAKLHSLDHKLKTLNRAVLISFGIIILVTAIILNDWCPESIAYQYFYGFSTVFLGTIVLLSYTIHAEYPIPGWLVPHLICVSTQETIDIDKSYLNMESSTSNNNNNNKTRTPQQSRMFGGGGGRSTGVEELNEFQPCISSQRYRNNTFSSQNSSDLETMETFGGSSLVSNNNLSMQLFHQQQPPQHQRNNSVSVQRTNSVNSAKRSSIVSFKIPRSMTNPSTSSSNNNGQCFQNGGPGMNGRFKHSTATQSCSCGNCPQYNSSQNQNQNGFSFFQSASSGVGGHRPRSHSNNSMASIFGFKNSQGLKPEREKCRLFGVDGNDGGCSDTSSYVFPSANSTSSFSNTKIYRPSTTTAGPINYLGPKSSIKLPPPPSSRRREECSYVPPNPSLPLPSSSSSSVSSGGRGCVGSTSTSGVGGIVGASLSSFTPNQDRSSSNSSSNKTLTNEYGGHDFDLNEHSQSTSTFPSNSKTNPRNGFNRQLPSIPPFASSSSFADISSSSSSKHIYAEPHAIHENVQLHRKNSFTPSNSTDSQETGTIYSTSPIVESLEEAEPGNNISDSANTPAEMSYAKNEPTSTIANGIGRISPEVKLTIGSPNPHYTPMGGLPKSISR